jgi:hypothetical protein
MKIKRSAENQVHKVNTRRSLEEHSIFIFIFVITNAAKEIRE